MLSKLFYKEFIVYTCGVCGEEGYKNINANSWHFLNTYYEPRSVLSTLQGLIYLILTTAMLVRC